MPVLPVRLAEYYDGTSPFAGKQEHSSKVAERTADT